MTTSHSGLLFWATLYSRQAQLWRITRHPLAGVITSGTRGNAVPMVKVFKNAHE